MSLMKQAVQPQDAFLLVLTCIAQRLGSVHLIDKTLNIKLADRE